MTHYPELMLDKWAERFGSLYSLWLGNQLFIIISSPEIAKDLMITNGAVFSSRKEMFIKSQTVFAGRGITATPYNDRWCVRRNLQLYEILTRERVLGENIGVLLPVGSILRPSTIILLF